MESKNFMTVDEVAQELNVSKEHTDARLIIIDRNFRW